MQKPLLYLLFMLGCIPAISQQIHPLAVENDLENQQIWVDSVYSNMSLEQKVGQLFIVTFANYVYAFLYLPLL